MASGGILGLAVLVILQRRIGWRRASAVSAIVLVALYNWRLIGDPVASVLGLGQDIAPAVIVVPLVAVAFAFGARFEVQVSLMLMGAVMVLLPLVTLGIWYAGDDHRLPPGASDIPDLLELGGDVHVLVLDGYGRADVLQSRFGHDNAEFESLLRDSGFEIPSAAHANFTTSAASISSAWLGEYVRAAEERLTDRERLALHRVIGGENPVAATFQRSGYEYVHIEGGWVASSCGPNVDRCVRSSLLDEAMWALIERSAGAWWFERRFGHSFSYNGLRALDNLIRLESEDSSGGKLVFTHVVLPHPPLLVDASCRIEFDQRMAGPGVSHVGASSALAAMRGEAYADQVECVNSKITDFVSHLEDGDVALIFGDHGPDSLGQLGVDPTQWTDDQIIERLAIFAAIRVPNCDAEIPSDFSPVNGLRLVVGCLSDGDLPLLEPRSFIFPMDWSPGAITEVTVPNG